MRTSTIWSDLLKKQTFTGVLHKTSTPKGIHQSFSVNSSNFLHLWVTASLQIITGKLQPEGLRGIFSENVVKHSWLRVESHSLIRNIFVHFFCKQFRCWNQEMSGVKDPTKLTHQSGVLILLTLTITLVCLISYTKTCIRYCKSTYAT